MKTPFSHGLFLLALIPYLGAKDLPKALLIGDSISIGYTPHVVAALKGKVDVKHHRGNAQHTGTGLKMLDRWIGETQWDVIHFNWGLHDLKYMGPKGENLFPKEKGGKPQVPLAAYEKNLEKLVVRLKKTGAKLIWRNTTPIPPGSKGRYVGDSVKYNEAAAHVMKRHGISTHDLFTISKKRMKELMLPANVHYKKEGSRVLGKDVARAIVEALKK